MDRAKGGWGHINVDDILFADAPPKGMHLPRLDQQPDFGSLLLGVLDEKARGRAAEFHHISQRGRRRSASTRHRRPPSFRSARPPRTPDW